MLKADKIFIDMMGEKLAIAQLHQTGVIDMQPPRHLQFRMLKHAVICPRCKGRDTELKARVYHKQYHGQRIFKRGDVKATWYICNKCDKIFSKDGE